MIEVLCFAVLLYTIAIVVRMVLSWFPPSDGVVEQVGLLLRRITEPVLAPARRLIPPLGAIDISPLVVLLVLQVVVRGLILGCGSG
ncbi:MAG: YggT family protein [Ilumatobacteraceae bacterium]